jgi:hypothetical protein
MSLLFVMRLLTRVKQALADLSELISPLRKATTRFEFQFPSQKPPDKDGRIRSGLNGTRLGKNVLLRPEFIIETDNVAVRV